MEEEVAGGRTVMIEGKASSLGTARETVSLDNGNEEMVTYGVGENVNAPGGRPKPLMV